MGGAVAHGVGSYGVSFALRGAGGQVAAFLSLLDLNMSSMRSVTT